MSLSAPTLAALDAAGLDARPVEELARRTVAEDLAGGVDVTSAATVPAEQTGTAAFVPRARGRARGAGRGDGRARRGVGRQRRARRRRPTGAASRPASRCCR